MTTLLRKFFFTLMLLHNTGIFADEKDMREQFAQGLALIHKKNYEQAVPIFSKLTQDYPALPEAYNNLAFIYAAQGNYIKAQDILQSAFKKSPSYSSIYDNLNMIYAKIARDIYEKEINAKNTSHEPLENLYLIEHIFDNTENKTTMKNNSFEQNNANAIPPLPLSTEPSVYTPAPK